MRTIFSLFVIVLVLGLTSCKKESKDPALCSGYWTTELEVELNAYIAAATAYYSDQSTANCNAYKEAYQEFLDAIRPYLDCSAYTAEQRQDIQDAIDDGEAEIASLNCGAK